MRVYLPSTLPALSQAHGAGELGPGPFEAYAVTPELREWCASDDAEELEYAALGQAARASLRLLAESPRSEAVPRRRVVVAVEVPDADAVADGSGGEAVGRVRLAAAVPLAKAAAVHVDADEAEEDVAAAVDALAAAGGSGGGQGERGPGAEEAVDGAEEHELLWFATQEIPVVLG